MSLNGILSSALTALQTNSAALRTVSNNVANLNTDGYARRTVHQEAASAGGQLSGVSIADIQRVVDQFLNQQTLSAGSASSRYDTQTGVLDQLNSLLGEPGGNTALTARLSQVMAALGQASLAPSASASQTGAVTAFQNLADAISSVSSVINRMQSQLDQQVATTTIAINAQIRQVFELNKQIAMQTIGGSDGASALLDQRDQILASLSQQIDIRTVDQGDGRLTVMTQDGVALVSDSYAELSYSPAAGNASYGSIMLQMINPSSGMTIGQPHAIDSHVSGGKLKGLLDMRDGTLTDLNVELGNLARNTALAFNRQSNANSSFPPPTSLSGRNTGLTATDPLNFTGKSTFSVADNSGNLVSRVDVNFATQTISVDGVAVPGTFTNTVGGFATALNTALGGNGTASFTNGVFSIAANGSNGIVISDDATTPASRGGSGFAQFFGMNDIFRSAAPSILATGFASGDASGLAAGTSISLSLKSPSGEVARSANISITAGMTMGNVVTALNTAMSGMVSFSLASDGTLNVTQAAGYTSFRLDVTGDTTQRGTTGMSFTQLFGLGSLQAANQASSFSVESSLAASPSRLAFAQATITPATVVGESIVNHGDTRGIIALQNIGTQQQSFARAGALSAQASSLGEYAAALYQDVATRSQTARAAATTQADRLTEVKSRQAQNSGVNLDEELSNMMIYQQSYSAGARMLQVVNELYDTLMQIH